MRTELFLLNRTELFKIIKEKNLKQWWICEQIRVSRRTLIRWLKGDVTRIHRENLHALAALLEVAPEQLVESDRTRAPEKPPSPFDSKDFEKLIEIFRSKSEWNLIEKLLRSTPHSDHPSDEQSIENKLTLVMSQLHQHLYQDAEKTLLPLRNEIAKNPVLEKFRWRADFYLANLMEVRGEFVPAIRIFTELTREDPSRALLEISLRLGIIFAILGEFSIAMGHFDIAERSLNESTHPRNASKYFLVRSFIEEEIGDLEKARESLQESKRWAKRAGYEIGIHSVHYRLATIESKKGRSKRAELLLRLADEGFDSLSREDNTQFEARAEIAANRGDYKNALMWQDLAIARMENNPGYQAAATLKKICFLWLADRKEEARELATSVRPRFEAWGAKNRLKEIDSYLGSVSAP